VELSSRRTPRACVSSAPKGNDSDLLVIGVILWLASVARVALAFAHHEVFGAETTLALGCVVGLPWLALRSRFSARPQRANSLPARTHRWSPARNLAPPVAKGAKAASPASAACPFDQ
jgi:hypothetical protein